MPRILFIGSGAPWLGGAGYLVRQNLFLQALRNVADVHLALFDVADVQTPEFAAGFTPLPAPARTQSSKMKRLADDLLSPTPRMFRGYDLSAPRAAVAALKPETFDAVFAFRIDFAYFAGVIGHPRLILDIDDPEHLRLQRRILATTGDRGDVRTRRDVIKLKRFEHDAEGAAKLAFVCQANEATGWPVAPVVVPNCVELIENPRRQDRGPRILFVGNTAGSTQNPNADGLTYFLSEIWPLIHQAMPAARFRIIGATSPTIQERARQSTGVELVGFVNDLKEEYAAASISVAPIRFGTGTRIKILEAFAHACPVVSTPAGADGIEAILGQEIEIAENSRGFADKCIELLNDATARQRIGHAGYALAGRLYDRKVQHVKIVELLQTFLKASA